MEHEHEQNRLMHPPPHDANAAPAVWDLVSPRSVSDEEFRRFEGYVSEIFAAFGMPMHTPGTIDTPRRFLRAMFDATRGYDGDQNLLTAFPSETSRHPAAIAGQVVEGAIEFACLCEHHALPFTGRAYVGYVPGEQIIGISKITRLVRLFARRFTVQERLAEQVADTLSELIDPRGVAVHLRARHLCTQMRGVEERSQTVTTAWRGVYCDPALRHEFLLQTRDQRS